MVSPESVKLANVGLEVVATVWLSPSRNAHSLVSTVFAPMAIEVAVATPKAGVTKVGEVSITKVVPVPVWAATAVALPTEVIGPVRFALVVTVAALPVIEPTMALVDSRSVNQPLVILAPVAPREPVIVILPEPRASPAKVGEEVVATVWLSQSRNAHSVVSSVFAPMAILVAVATPKTGVTKVGVSAKTKAPDPVSSEITPSSSAEVVAANWARVPP